MTNNATTGQRGTRESLPVLTQKSSSQKFDHESSGSPEGF